MLTAPTALAEDHRDQLLEEARRHRLAQVTHRTHPPRWWRRTGNRRTAAAARRWVMVALAGVVLLGLSATTLTLNPGAGGGIKHVGAVPVLADARLAEVATAELVYAPGHSSGWHVHSGVHSVVVLSGTLTVYDEACRRHDYRPGQTYLGGREPHLASNTGAEAVGLAITSSLTLQGTFPEVRSHRRTAARRHERECDRGGHGSPDAQGASPPPSICSSPDPGLSGRADPSSLRSATSTRRGGPSWTSGARLPLTPGPVPRKPVDMSGPCLLAGLEDAGAIPPPIFVEAVATLPRDRGHEANFKLIETPRPAPGAFAEDPLCL